MKVACETSDLLVFAHLRWDLVCQRPQHLMSRYAKYRRVFYIEGPLFGMTDVPYLHLSETAEGVQLAVPYLPTNILVEDIQPALTDLINELLFDENIRHYSTWYYSPMALVFSGHLKPETMIFDCMDELSILKEAPKNLVQLENELLKHANLVFAGGHALYEAKKHAHYNIHSLPSSIDYDHFSTGRLQLVEPDDQVHIPHPRIGFYGVIDERFNSELLTKMADLRPDHHFVVIGPVVEIEASFLPQNNNVHYLGKKEYHTLPLYIAGWDCAMMPFALNEFTRYYSPSQTPEFLAAGKPVVSTAIRDVVHPYGREQLVQIATDAEEFITLIDRTIGEKSRSEWLEKVDAYLAEMSWDHTFEQMVHLESDFIKSRKKDRKSEAPILAPMSASADEVI